MNLKFLSSLTIFAFLGFFADGLTFWLALVFGVLLTTLVNLKFIFENKVKTIIVLGGSVVMHLIVYYYIELDFYQERIGLMVMPLVYLFVLRMVMKSRFTIYLEYQTRMFLRNFHL